ncbi:MAG: DUF3500 domain-containing protein [Actinomycetota bacterium]
MIEQAVALLASFDDEQRPLATAPFADEALRRDWHYIPRREPGLWLGAMRPEQRRIVHDLLGQILSLDAHAKVTTIMGLEEVLNRIEGGTHRIGRDSSAYRVLLFGEPGDRPWGWKFEGHHVSVNVTLVGEEVSATPLFLGANPAHVAHDGRTITRPLAEEEDVGRALLHALTAAQRRASVISDRAPDDIVTGAAPTVDHIADEGVAVGDLSGEAAELAETLVRLYVTRLAAVPPPPDRNAMRFVWAGSPEVGRPHYYRLAHPRFLVELDNTQDGANHVHTVWRDPSNDFGDDLLRRHAALSHGGSVASDSTQQK